MQSLDTRKWGEEREKEEKKILAEGGQAGRRSHPRQKKQQPEGRTKAGPTPRWLTMGCPAFVELTQLVPEVLTLSVAAWGWGGGRGEEEAQILTNPGRIKNDATESEQAVRRGRRKLDEPW